MVLRGSPDLQIKTSQNKCFVKDRIKILRTKSLYTNEVHEIIYINIM